MGDADPNLKSNKEDFSKKAGSGKREGWIPWEHKSSKTCLQESSLEWAATAKEARPTCRTRANSRLSTISDLRLANAIIHSPNSLSHLAVDSAAPAWGISSRPSPNFPRCLPKDDHSSRSIVSKSNLFSEGLMAFSMLTPGCVECRAFRSLIPFVSSFRTCSFLREAAATSC